MKIESNTENIFEAFEIMRNFDFMQDPAKIKQYVVKRLEKNKITQIYRFEGNANPEIFAIFQKCQPTSATVERSF